MLVPLAVALAFASGVRAGAAVCVGDCSGDGSVTVDEIATLIAIATQQRPITDCSNQDGGLSVDEIVGAVGNLLNGCPRAGGKFLYPAPQFLSGAPSRIADANGDGFADLIYPTAVLPSKSEDPPPLAALASLSGNVVAYGDFDSDGTSDTVSIPYAQNRLDVELSRPPLVLRLQPTGPLVAVGVGDLDGDGALDIVAANPRERTMLVYQGNGAGMFTLGEIVMLLFRPRSLVVSDFDADGKAEVVVSKLGDPTLTILERRADGATVVAGELTESGATGDYRQIASVDVDQDGDLDLVTVSEAGHVAYWLGAGNGTFQLGDPPFSGITAFAFADFDADGVGDFAVADRSEVGEISVFLGGQHCAGACSRFTLGESVVGLAAGDFTGDGLLDLLTSAGSVGGSSASAMATVIEGRGDGTFISSRRQQLGQYPWIFVTADFNNDHSIDIAQLTFQPDGVSVSLRDPAGNFENTSVLPVTYSADGRLRYFFDAADIDGDGSADVMSVERDAKIAQVHWGNGDGTFETGEPVAMASSPQSITAVDLNGDSRVDAVVTTEGPDTVTALYSQPNGQFEQVAIPLPSTPQGKAVIGDIDGDSRPDVLVAATGFTVLMNREQGLVLGATLAPEAAPGLMRLYAAEDLNHDGFADLVFQFDFLGFAVLLGNGDGTFRSPRIYSALNFYSVLDVGDANGDGHPDLFVRDEISSLVLYLGDGTGAFVGPQRFNVGAITDGFHVIDANGDGIDDLLASGYKSGLAEIHGAGCDKEPEYALAGPQFAGEVGYDPAVGDVNRDGILDLVSGGFQGEQFNAYVTLGAGVGEFQARTRVPDTTATSVALGDLDGDGALDLVTIDETSDRVSLLRGAGNGSFTRLADYAVGPRPSSALIADMNDDSRADVVTLNSADRSVTVILAVADGGHETLGTFATGAGIGDGPLAVGDLDANGTLDLAASHVSGIGILRGNGDGSLAGLETIDLGSRSRSIVAGDFNEDGIADLAVTTASSSEVTILLGQRGTGPAVAGRFHADGSPGRVAAADLNDDGHLDLVCGSDGAAQVAVLMGRGDGTFEPAGRFASSFLQGFILIDDFDGDGVADVVTSPGVVVQMHKGVILPCAQTHDTYHLDPYQRCAVSAPTATQQTLACRSY